jgi:hypothetical protein
MRHFMLRFGENLLGLANLDQLAKVKIGGSL